MQRTQTELGERRPCVWARDGAGRDLPFSTRPGAAGVWRVHHRAIARGLQQAKGLALLQVLVLVLVLVLLVLLVHADSAALDGLAPTFIGAQQGPPGLRAQLLHVARAGTPRKSIF